MEDKKQNVYEYQTLAGRRFNIKAYSLREAEEKATEWHKKNAPNTFIELIKTNKRLG